MAYGIDVTGVNGIYQLNSGAGTRHLAVVSSGTTSGAGGISGYLAGDLVVGRPTSGSGIFGATFTSTPPTLNVAGTYKILRPINTISTASITGDYGVVVYDTNGTTKMFDSRAFSNGLKINAIWHKASLDGAKQVSGSLTTTNNTLFTATSAAIYDNTMVSLNSGAGVGTNLALDAFYFDSAEYKVLFHSFIDSSAAPGGSVDGVPNLGEILVGEFI